MIHDHMKLASIRDWCTALCYRKCAVLVGIVCTLPAGCSSDESTDEMVDLPMRSRNT